MSTSSCFPLGVGTLGGRAFSPPIMVTKRSMRLLAAILFDGDVAVKVVGVAVWNDWVP